MNWNKPKVYAVKHKNEKVIMSSRSGGVFTAISDYVIAWRPLKNDIRAIMQALCSSRIGRGAARRRMMQ